MSQFNVQKLFNSNQKVKTVKPFPWGKVSTKHEIGPYMIFEYHPYRAVSANDPIFAGTGAQEIDMSRTEFHVFVDGQDTHRGSLTLEGAMLIAISYKTLGPTSGGELAMIARALKLNNPI